uniref:DUF6451 domain-containing protein n=1 Tax=Arion vulgaris TaxID=1028688 RepID=A0A0B7BF64_9EUPU
MSSLKSVYHRFQMSCLYILSAFAVKHTVWKSTAISMKIKLRIFSSNVKSVLLYGSETWRVAKLKFATEVLW